MLSWQRNFILQWLSLHLKPVTFKVFKAVHHIGATEPLLSFKFKLIEILLSNCIN